MKIEKLDRDNIKEYIRDMKITDTYNLENNIDKFNQFGIKKDDKFIFSFFLTDDCICASFGNCRVDNSLVKEIFMFLNNNLSFDGHLLVQIVDNKIMDIMDDLYRIKDVSITKRIKDSIDTGSMKERYADIDMRSIKYFASKGNVFCNLYSQNIQNEDIIKKLDKFFSDLDVCSIDFTIIPDSLKYMESLGYKCFSKRYVIDYE
ncbi:MAG: hypothetical protein ACI4VL_01520 [Bacilli bacterium]